MVLASVSCDVRRHNCIRFTKVTLTAHDFVFDDNLLGEGTYIVRLKGMHMNVVVVEIEKGSTSGSMERPGAP